MSKIRPRSLKSGGVSVGSGRRWKRSFQVSKATGQGLNVSGLVHEEFPRFRFHFSRECPLPEVFVGGCSCEGVAYASSMRVFWYVRWDVPSLGVEIACDSTRNS